MIIYLGFEILESACGLQLKFRKIFRAKKMAREASPSVIRCTCTYRDSSVPVHNNKIRPIVSGTFEWATFRLIDFCNVGLHWEASRILNTLSSQLSSHGPIPPPDEN